MRILKGHRGPVRAVAYAPDDGETLASLGGDGAVRLWNLPRSESWAHFPYSGADRAEHADLIFSPDGNHLVVAAGYPRVLDVVGERWAGALSGTALGYRSLAFAPGGRALAGAPVTAPRPGADGWLEVREWVPAAPRESAGSEWEDNFSQRWDEAGLPGVVRAVAWAPDGRTLAAAYDGRCVSLWGFDPEAPGLRVPRVFRGDPYSRRPAPPVEEARRPLPGREGWMVRRPVERLAFLPGPESLLAVAAGPAVELWDAARHKRRRVIRCRPGPPRALAVSPDGRLLLTGGPDGTVRLWEAATGVQLQAFDWKLGPIHTLAFSPDGMTAAAGGDRPDVVVWDVDEG